MMAGGARFAQGGSPIDQRQTAPTLAQVVSADAVNEWAGKAQPGETFVYYSGAFLVKSMPAVIAADALIARGEVIAFQKRIASGGFDYIIQKRRNAERLASCAAVSGRRVGAAVDDEEVEQLMAVLRRLANFGKALPPFRELAAQAQLRDGESARYRLKLLVKAERVRVFTPDEGPLVVTIVSSGRSTSRC